MSHCLILPIYYFRPSNSSLSLLQSTDKIYHSATVPWLPESPRWLIAHEYVATRPSPLLYIYLHDCRYEDEAFKILADIEGLSEDDPFM